MKDKFNETIDKIMHLITEDVMYTKEDKLAALNDIIKQCKTVEDDFDKKFQR